MTGILMGTETVDQHGVPYVLVIPDVSVFDPGNTRYVRQSCLCRPAHGSRLRGHLSNPVKCRQ